MKRAQAIAPITSLQPPYSLIRREIEEEVLPFCQRQGIGVIVYSPMASGLLTGAMTRERIAKLPDDDWRKRHPSFQEPRLSEHLALVERLRSASVEHDRSPGEVAIAWTLAHSAVTGRSLVPAVRIRPMASWAQVRCGSLLRRRRKSKRQTKWPSDENGA